VSNDDIVGGRMVGTRDTIGGRIGDSVGSESLLAGTAVGTGGSQHTTASHAASA
jgi:hypothetical protein